MTAGPLVEERAAQLFKLATAHYRAGRPEAAEAACQQVLGENPAHIGALCMLAILRYQAGRTNAAFEAVLQAVAQRADSLTLCTLGIIARGCHKLPQAESAYREAIKRAPNSAEIHNELALLYSDTGRTDEAESAFLSALKIRRDYAEAHNNLGVLFKKTGRRDDALAAYRRALELKPNYAEAHNNIGVILKEDGQLDEAAQAYRQALALKPDYADARWNLAMALLTAGRYREGWPCYEARHHPNRTEAVSEKPKLSCPQWTGQPLNGRSIIVWTEQGFGDQIQFARYLPLIKQRGTSRLTVACPPALKSLLETADGVDEVITQAPEPSAPHDYWVFPMSLPAVFGSELETLPASQPYLRALPERVSAWQSRLPEQNLKVGLVWKGNPGHDNDAHRSFRHLAQLEPLWSVPGVTFVSLQKGCGEADAAGIAASQPIVRLGNELENFGDTAALVSALDLLITVDTAVAHVAGALGKPCWVLLPHIECDWRWMRERKDSPWYPNNMRLFRQTPAARWDDVVETVAHALEDWVRSLVSTKVSGKQSEKPTRLPSTVASLASR